MEQNFQTSFIPKKPIIAERPRSSSSVGLFLVLSIFVFLSMVASAGGIYFYKGIVSKNIIAMEGDLDKAKNRFEPDLITKLQDTDQKLKAANEILSQHIAISPIFQALSEITMKSVRYTKFGYDVGTSKESKIMIKLSGQANRYSSVGLQSDLFKKNKNLIDPVFSNLVLDDKGNVGFDLEFSVDPSFVAYKKTVEDEIASNTSQGINEETPMDITGASPDINTEVNAFLTQ